MHGVTEVLWGIGDRVVSSEQGARMRLLRRSGGGSHSRVRTSVAVVAGAAVTALLLAGCSAKSQGEGAPSGGSPIPTSQASSTQSPIQTQSSAQPGRTQPAGPHRSGATSTAAADDGSSSPSLSTSPPARSSSMSTSPVPTTTTPPVPPRFASNPDNGATDVNPTDKITVSASFGKLQSVSLTNEAGATVDGAMSADHRTWTVGEPLGYGKTYTWSGKAMTDKGVTAALGGSFTTVEPSDTVGARFFNEQPVKDGDTVGVGTPIILQIYRSVDASSRADVEKHLQVISEPPQQGSWAWIGSNDKGDVLHYRPKTYWKPGTAITVNAKLYGVPYDHNGAYGAESMTWHLTIGRQQITYGNVQTHHLIVKRAGKVRFDFPASFGLDSVSARQTPVGNYITMEKYKLKLMSSAHWGYTDSEAPYATRISNNGVFIHGYEHTIDVQGKENVSHGCTNISPDNARKFYDATLWGDPVIITDPGHDAPTLGDDDGDVWDWTLSYDMWQQKSALR